MCSFRVASFRFVTMAIDSHRFHSFCLNHNRFHVTRTKEERSTQVVKCLRAGRVVPQGLFVELGRLLVVLPAEHRVALVVERRRVVPVGVHGQVGVSVGLVVVLLLSQDKE